MATAPDPPRTSSSSATAPETTAEPVEVVLTPDAIQRAGIATAAVRSDVIESTITVPATVTSNAYRETKVNALVGGIVQRVQAALGKVGGAVPHAQLAVFAHDGAVAGPLPGLGLVGREAARHEAVRHLRRAPRVGPAGPRGQEY